MEIRRRAGRLALDRANTEFFSPDRSPAPLIGEDRLGSIDLVELAAWCVTTNPPLGDVAEPFARTGLPLIYERQAAWKQRHGRYTLEEAAEAIERGAGERCKVMMRKLKGAAEACDLLVYEPGRWAKYEYGPGAANEALGFYEEACWEDLNDWLKRKEPRIEFRFPDPAQQSIVAARPALAADEKLVSGPVSRLVSEAAKAIALQLHPTDYLAQAAFADALEEDMVRAIRSGALRAYSPRLKGYWNPPESERVLWVKDADADAWFASQGRPYRLQPEGPASQAEPTTTGDVFMPLEHAAMMMAHDQWPDTQANREWAIEVWVQKYPEQPAPLLNGRPDQGGFLRTRSSRYRERDSKRDRRPTWPGTADPLQPQHDRADIGA